MCVGGIDFGVVGVIEFEDCYYNLGNIVSSLYVVVVFEKFIVDLNGSSEFESFVDG